MNCSCSSIVQRCRKSGWNNDGCQNVKSVLAMLRIWNCRRRSIQAMFHGIIIMFRPSGHWSTCPISPVQSADYFNVLSFKKAIFIHKKKISPPHFAPCLSNIARASCILEAHTALILLSPHLSRAVKWTSRDLCRSSSGKANPPRLAFTGQRRTVNSHREYLKSFSVRQQQPYLMISSKLAKW